MHNWFECKVRYEKIGENGASKKVTELYLVDALSCTEAEARATEEVSPYISGEFNISSVKQAKYGEIFLDEADSAGLRLGSRIHDLRREGLPIDTEMIIVNGKRVARYSLCKEQLV